MERDFFKQPHLLAILLSVGLWLLVFNQGLVTAYDVWVVSEIYNHCLLILPIFVYLVWDKWQQLTKTVLKPNLYLLLPIAALFFIQTFGSVGDIKIIMHIATFCALPLMIWSLLGNQAAKVIGFPLFFLLFAIPIGDQLIPYLQELTTDIAVPMLNLSGVPVYRNGLYLDIPEGQFLVAEACSGISFLITSTAFGFLYAYLFFQSRKRQVLFVTISVLLPIAANAIRVYGIILTGHLTDMEHAVGTDHLIYGGVFYALLLFLLIVFGEFIKEPKKQAEDTTILESQNPKVIPKADIIKLLTPLIILVVVQQSWLYSIKSNDFVSLDSLKNEFNNVDSVTPITPDTWQPQVHKSLQTSFIKIKESRANLELFTTYSGDSNSTLISSINRPFIQKSWSILRRYSLNSTDSPKSVTVITSPRGLNRTIVKWHKLGKRRFKSDAKAKLYRAWLATTGQPIQGFSFYLSIDGIVAANDIEGLDFDKIEASGYFSLVK